MHGRVSLSAISTFRWTLEEDLAFYERAGITSIGASLAKLETAGLDQGASRVRDAGLRVSNLIGIGPFRLDDPGQWASQRDRVLRALDAAEAVQAECMILTTGPAGQLSWENAADALEQALSPVIADAHERGIPFGLEHTNSRVRVLETERDAPFVRVGDHRAQRLLERIRGVLPRELTGRAGREDHAFGLYRFGRVEGAEHAIALTGPLAGVIQTERPDPDQVAHAQPGVAHPARALVEPRGLELGQRRADRRDPGSFVEREILLEGPSERRDRRERDAAVHVGAIRALRHGRCSRHRRAGG